MTDAIEGVLLSRDEARLMESLEELDVIAAKATNQYERFIKAVNGEEEDFHNLRYRDVPKWFRVANYVVFVGLPVWGLWKIFS